MSSRRLTTLLGVWLPFRGLLNRVQPVPPEWLEEAKERQCRELKPLPCTDYNVLVNAWKKTMKWTEGLDRALACMLATITSTKVVGDQLWMRIISPPSSGKSVLCEALSVARKHVRALSTLRGFHSGYKTDADGSEDVSLIEQLRDKTLIVKDGDTLLRSPNRDQILSEARDLYDRVSRAHYRNNLARAYEGVNITFLLCGTPLLSQLDSSELGERFLDCRIVHTMDPELEDDIGWRVALGSDANMSYESNGRADEQHAPERTEAMRLTGGFVEYLRTNALSRLRQTTTPDWALRACQQYGTFVSHMRSRPVVDRSRTDTSGEPQRELSFRLISQLVRLARCLAVVLGKSTVDAGSDGKGQGSGTGYGTWQHPRCHKAPSGKRREGSGGERNCCPHDVHRAANKGLRTVPVEGGYHRASDERTHNGSLPLATY
jgi:hypothetical protein